MQGDGLVPWLFESEHLVRTITRDGDPWWVAPDVCASLQIKNVSDAVSRLDVDEKGLAEIETLGGVQKLNVVSEPGLYKLVGRSNKPVARRFDRWVRHDVLPAIRKTGRYETPRADASVAPAFTMAMEDARKENIRTRRQLVSEARQTHGINAARELWVYLGLPIVPAMMSPGAPELPFTYTAVKHEAEQKDEAA